MAEVTLVWTPIPAPLTTTEKVHEAPGAKLAPVRLMLLDPATAVIVPPPHAPTKPLSGCATVRPAGSVSLKAISLNGAGLSTGLLIVKLRIVLPNRNSICESLNALVSVGGLSTVTEAEAVFPLPASFDVMGVVRLFFMPGFVALTGTVNVHDVPGINVPPAKVILFVGGPVSVSVPPHATPLPVITVSPAGSESLKPRPVNETVGFGLKIVKAKLATAFV